MKRMVLLISALALCWEISQAQTLHAVVFCNTIDESIGENMKIDLKNSTDKIRTIARVLDYDLDLQQLDGKDCTRAKLKAAIDEMVVEPDDVVFTFYGGHGTHAMNNASDPWPQYCMNTGFENQGNWVPMATVDKWVAAKSPRLRIIVANCCNKEQRGTTVKPLWADDGRAKSLSDINPESMKALFGVKGSIMATSSKLGQLSWCNALYGGIFTSQFWDAMEKVGNGRLKADWENLLKDAAESTGQYRFRTDEPPYTVTQNPYYKVNISGSGTIKKDNDKNPGKDRNPGTPLDVALQRLLNKDLAIETRLDMIPGVLNTYFAPGTKVMTYANDLKTVVDYEDAADFLRRIARSPYIKQVNVLENANNVIKVHELR